ncbi:CTAG/Pcc1 family [Lipomyces oligophaga]|uniref:CTAG/Pcc1 family n=1 Tax=Lipomyces oligophaga TaxID=45792 RepID=UPI0034CF1BE1
MPELLHRITIRIPFPSRQYADIAYAALSPDPVLKPDQFDQTLRVISASDEVHEQDPTVSKYEVNCAVLEVEARAVSDRALRVGTNGLFESLRVVVECFEQLR